MLQETIEQQFRTLNNSQQQLSTLLESVADNQDWQPVPGEWSFRYIAAHMATVEEDCYRERVMRIASGENPYFEYYLNTGWDFSALDLRHSLEAWAVTRQEIIDYVRALPEEKLSLTGTHATFGTITLSDVLQMMLDHDQEHLESLEKVISEYRTKP